MGMKDIGHVVVLMLENRSFDAMLGWLYERDAPARNIPPAKPGDAFRGLSGVDLERFINRAGGDLSSPPVRGTKGFAVPSVAPGEEFEHVNMQFFGTETPGPGAEATMTGVLQDFVNVMKSQGYDDSTIRATAPMIMQTYTQRQVPVLNQLARHYAVSDDWFASVPSQTNPNRAFLITGTSHGLVNNGQLEKDPRAKALESILGMGIGDDRFPDATIFNALAAAGVDWTVFWQTSYLPHKISTLLSEAPQLIALIAPLLDPTLAGALADMLTRLKPYADYINDLASGQLSSNNTWRLFPAIQQIPDASQHFKKLDQFHALARAGQLPRFSYIEPYWTIAQSSTDAGLKNLFTEIGNDYHPPGNVIVAENFVKDVYSSLIANQAAWNKTLLVITFDEFVGSFDHVAPPEALPPWVNPPDFPTNGFDFKRYGARVPSILVSPLVQKGTVFRSSTSVPFDHTSVIATTLKWLGQESRVASFGQRTMHAPTFDDVLTLSQPRTDAGEIGFLEVKRNVGDAVRFGDLILLRNQNGKYVSSASLTMKVVARLPSDDLMGFAVDLNLAAYFPTLGDNPKATLTFETSQADAPSQVPDGAQLFIVTQESGVGAANFLGAWSDSRDCYYYNNYVQGGYVDNETWVVKQVDKHGQPLCYGDRIYLENVRFAGQRLSQDPRLLQGEWITSLAGGDYWTVEPAVTGAM